MLRFARSFVGADAHLGAKSRALRGCASKLACGRRIGPLKCCEFALVFHKTEQFRRADRVVRPYGVEWKTNADSPENRHKTGVSCGSMWASTPTVRNGKRGDFPPDPHDFSRASVGADDSVRPQNPAIFVTAPTVQNGKPTRIRRKTAIKRAFLAGRCGHRPLRCETGNAAISRLTHTIFHAHL